MLEQDQKCCIASQSPSYVYLLVYTSEGELPNLISAQFPPVLATVPTQRVETHLRLPHRPPTPQLIDLPRSQRKGRLQHITEKQIEKI